MSDSDRDHTSAPPRVADAVDVVGAELEIRIMSGDYRTVGTIVARARKFNPTLPRCTAAAFRSSRKNR